MASAKPINVESEIGIHELFFSVTDQNGIIKTGNDVFARVSEYDRSELISKPHNVIRHPDMPRSVFKVFWNFLKSDRPIGAYVKNLSKDGKYYWVFAVAFPAKEQFVSIRIKPSSEIFEHVRRIYSEVLNYEKKNGMEKAEEFLLQKLSEL